MRNVSHTKTRARTRITYYRLEVCGIPCPEEACTTKDIWFSSLRFPSPDPTGGAPPPSRPPLANGVVTSAGRELPLGATPLVPPHSARIRPHPRFRHSSVSLQPRHPVDENQVLLRRHRPARCGNRNRIRRLMFVLLEIVEPAQPGEDRAPFSVLKSLRISKTP